MFSTMFPAFVRICLATLYIFGPIRCNVLEEKSFCELQNNEESALSISSDAAQGHSRSSRSRRNVDIDVNEVVHLHNQIRASTVPSASNMKYMSWNEGLAEKAQGYSEKCVFEHNPDDSYIGRGYTAVGENMYVTTAKTLNWFDAIGQWADEVADYEIYNETCKAGKVCGHYTQVVWADSYQVGCGLTKCDTVEKIGMTNAFLVICNYGPRGNMIGRKPYMIGERCTECRQGDNCSMGGLCSNPFRDTSTCVSAHPMLLLVCAMVGRLLWS